MLVAYNSAHSQLIIVNSFTEYEIIFLQLDILNIMHLFMVGFTDA